MPISTADLAKLSKSSLDDYLKNTPVDQIAQNKPLLKKLLAGKKPFGGAKQFIVEQIHKSNDSNFRWTFGEAKTQFNRRDTLAQTQFPWRVAEDAMYHTHDELFSNGIEVKEGDHGAYKLDRNEKVQLTDFLDENLSSLREGFMESLDLEMHRDGTSSADAIVGLNGLISLYPTQGTVGGIDRSLAANAYWRNFAALNVTQANLIKTMNAAWRETIRHSANSAPDFILAGSDFIDAYAGAITVVQNADAGKSKKRIDFSIGDAVNTGLYFKGREIIWDPSFDSLDTLDNPQVQWKKRCYFLNMKHIKWRDNGYDITSPTRPHDTRCLYHMIVLRCAMSINKPNTSAVLALS